MLWHCGGDTNAGPDSGTASDATLVEEAVPDSETPRDGERILDSEVLPAEAGTCGSPGSPCDLDASIPPCEGGWSCAVDVKCPSSSAGSTTLTGTVFDPAGTTPLPDVVVFIPSDVRALPSVVEGTNACMCQQSMGAYVVATITGANGGFTLKGVPTGSAVPVTVQTGKWRRTVNVNIANDCGLNSVADGTLRLPRSRVEGDMPQMALVTGGSDDLGCTLRRMGIDPGEYSAPHGGGRLDIYRGVAAASGSMFDAGPGLSSGRAGDCTRASCPLWASKASLERYDAIFLSCEGDPYSASKPPAAIQAMHDWLNEGGRLLATHSQSVWFQSGPADFQNIAVWKAFSAAIASGAYSIDMSFIQGKLFQTWLDDLDAATQASISLSAVSDTIASWNVGSGSRWIYDPGPANPPADAALTYDPKILSFRTPVGGVPGDAGRQYCGEAVFTDVHAGTTPSGDLPGACQTGPLTAQERALEFFVFDLSTCVVESVQKVGPPL
jgi:hypothetical protein